jgi:hypothetical protein
MSSIRQILRAAVEAAQMKAIAAGTLTIADPNGLSQVSIERPARAEHGDY